MPSRQLELGLSTSKQCLKKLSQLGDVVIWVVPSQMSSSVSKFNTMRFGNGGRVHLLINDRGYGASNDGQRTKRDGILLRSLTDRYILRPRATSSDKHLVGARHQSSSVWITQWLSIFPASG
jgi:hypothetical protein